MGFDWGQVLGVDEDEALEAYDQAVADALYQDHPRQVPGDHPRDPGDHELNLPIDEV